MLTYEDNNQQCILYRKRRTEIIPTNLRQNIVTFEEVGRTNFDIRKLNRLMNCGKLTAFLQSQFR